MQGQPVCAALWVVVLGSAGVARMAEGAGVLVLAAGLGRALPGVLDLAGVERLTGVLTLAAGLARARSEVLDLAGAARLVGVLRLAEILVLAADLEGAFREGTFCAQSF